eukprot:tig00021133_g18923.t1
MLRSPVSHICLLDVDDGEELEVVEASKLERLEARGAGIVGIIGHVSFLASTSYVGGDSTSEAQSAMGDSLNWALMRPTNAPWVQNTSSRTAAQKYADEFSTVIFWTSIAFFGIWVLRWVTIALCRTALKKWSDGRLPPLFRFPFLELCFIMMCSPGLVLHAARVAAVGNAGPSWGPPVAFIMIVIIPGFFLIGCSFMLVTNLMGQTIVFTKEDRIAEKLEAKSVDPSDVRVTRWQRFWNALKHPRRGFWEQTEYDQNDFMNRYSALFDAFAYARLGFMAAMLDSLKKVVSSLILGVHAGRGASSNAGTALGALLGVNLAYLSYLALSRPFIDRVENVVQMTSNGLQSVLLILMLMRNANYKKDEVSTGVMVVNMLSMAVLVVNQLRALRAIYNLTCPKKAAEKRARFKELQLDAGSDRKDKAVSGPRDRPAVLVAGARQQPAAGASARHVSIVMAPELISVSSGSIATSSDFDWPWQRGPETKFVEVPVAMEGHGPPVRSEPSAKHAVHFDSAWLHAGRQRPAAIPPEGKASASAPHARRASSSCPDPLPAPPLGLEAGFVGAAPLVVSSQRGPAGPAITSPSLASRADLYVDTIEL